MATEALRHYQANELTPPKEFLQSNEIQLDPESENVIDGLMEARDEGRHAGKYAVASILNGRRVGFIGEPGNGKTTLMLQAVHAAQRNAERLGIEFNPRIGQYDTVLAELRDKEGSPDEWDKSAWGKLNQRLTDVFRASNVFEDPGVGYVREKDRGVTAYENLISGASGESDETVLVYITRNPLLQFKSALLRPHISTLKDWSEVFPQLEKHKIEILGVNRDKKGARTIQKMFGNMGRGNHIEAIKKEEDSKIARWTEEIAQGLTVGEDYMFKDDKDYLSTMAIGIRTPNVSMNDAFRQIYGEFDIEEFDGFEESINMRARGAEEQMKLQILYMEGKMRRMGMGKENALLCHNPYTPEKNIIDLAVLQRVA